MNILKRDNISVWEENGKLTYAFVNNGGRDWFISPEERLLPAEEFHKKIASLWQNGKNYRCSGCGVLMEKEKVAGWPLFAGVACATCMKKVNDLAEAEQKAGKICRRCQCVYSRCCC